MSSDLVREVRPWSLLEGRTNRIPLCPYYVDYWSYYLFDLSHLLMYILTPLLLVQKEGSLKYKRNCKSMKTFFRRV